MSRYAHTIAVAQPPAGQGAEHDVGGDGPELIVACAAVFVASAAVANRMLELLVLDPGGVQLAQLVAPSGNIAANGAVHASWGYGLVRGADTLPSGALVVTQALPRLWLPEGAKVQFAVDSIAAGDQLSALSVTVVREGDDADTMQATAAAPAPIGAGMGGAV